MMKKDLVYCTLEEISNITYGKNLPKNKWLKEGFPVFGANGVIGFYSKYLYEEEQVLISCRGAASGAINLSPPKAFITNNSLIVEVSKKSIEKKYLYYILQGSNRSRIVTGSAQPQVTINNAITLNLPLNPLPIQRVIVSKIEELYSSLDRGIVDLKKAQKQLKLYRQSLLRKAFEGEMTKKWREKNNVLTKWEYVKLKDKSERVSVGHVGKTSEFYCDKKNGIPFLRSQNVKKGKISYKGLKYITPEFHKKLKKSQLKSGDLLIVRVGANRGDAVVLPTIIDEINCANIIFARVVGIDYKFLNYYFNSPFWLDNINSITTGSAQGVINTTIVAETIIPLPILEEQNEIVKEIETNLTICDVLEDNIKNSFKKAEILRQSILKRAFEGKLLSDNEIANCKKELDFEPASVLLEKIKAEKKKK